MSISEFFSMSGYGVYIWSSFAMALVLMVGEAIYVKRKYAATLKRVKRIVQMNKGQNA